MVDYISIKDTNRVNKPLQQQQTILKHQVVKKSTTTTIHKKATNKGKIVKVLEKSPTSNCEFWKQ